MTGTKLLSILLILPLFAIAQKYDRKAEEAEGLKVGTLAPDFKASDQKGYEYHLQNALKEGPVVMIFYRGHWCPVCNRHLSKLEEELSKITDRGASVIAVSPEKPDYIQKTIEKTGASYTLIHDADYKISNTYDVTFLPNGITRTMYSTALGADFNNAYPGDSNKLPIPATYIIGKDGSIIWRHFNPNYKKRAAVDQIVKALEEAGY